ncbi:ATP synthase subunit I [Neisseriaceae bacterium TC5R-5]|nr:ATP synthase subunit I [Neisseriaceae bacterium TC5R-5]
MKTEVKRILRLQCTLIGLAVLVGILVGAGNVALPVSVLLGGLSVLLPGVIYAKIAYAKQHIPPAELLKAHFKAEAVKFVLTILVFAAILLVFKDLSIAGVFGGFFAATSGYWFGLLIK